MVSNTIRDYGDGGALLLECPSTEDVLALAASLRAAELTGVLDIVPAARTVLVRLADPAHQEPTRQRLKQWGGVDLSDAEQHPGGGVDVTIDVVYDGPPDLDDVAAHTGMTPGEVIEAHTATPGGSDSVDSHRVSPTSSTATRSWRCRAAVIRAPPYRPDRSAWPVSSVASTRANPPPAAGS